MAVVEVSEAAGGAVGATAGAVAAGADAAAEAAGGTTGFSAGASVLGLHAQSATQSMAVKYIDVERMASIIPIQVKMLMYALL